MKINEIVLKESPQRVDEIVGRAIAGGLGALAGGLLGGPVGAAAGAAGGTWLAQKAKNILDPDDPIAVDQDRALKITVNKILDNYKTTLKQAGALSPDQVLNWANEIFTQTYIPGTQVPYTFKTLPTATDPRSVERWIKQGMVQAHQDYLRNPRAVKNPNDPLTATPDPASIPPDGSTLRTNKGMYSVVSGAWVDMSGNPASPEASEQLSQMWEQKNQITAVAGYPARNITITTSVGQFNFTNVGGPKWFVVTPGAPGSASGPRVTDPKIIAKLNEIAKQQATP